MTCVKRLLFLAILTWQSAISVAAEGHLSGNYLEGKWSEHGKEGCASANAAYVMFNKNHTLEAGQGESVKAVGFWEVGDGTVTLHLLVATVAGEAVHPFYQRRYYYQYMSPQIVTLQSDSFVYTNDTGTEIKQQKTLTRCQ